MTDRLPKTLRRRTAVEAEMTARWTERPAPDDGSQRAHIPYWNPVLQEDYCHADGEPWPCLHDRQNRPPKCRCSHVQHPNGQCWSRACGCTENRPDVTA